MAAVIRSIQIGRVREFTDDHGKVWTSAIAKQPVAGSAHVLKTHIEGDEQADRKHHGGPDKAVLAYSVDHFEVWKAEVREFEAVTLMNGAFGENLSVEGLTESDVCIGDAFTIGSAKLQVSQPRQPCWKLSRRWHLPKLAVRVQQTGRTGWYFRVLVEGEIRPGDQVTLAERPHPEWPVAKAHSVMHAKPRIKEDDLQLARCELLSESWRNQLFDRSSSTAAKTSAQRLFGEQPRDEQ